MASIGELIKKPSFLIHILELILAVIGVALLQEGTVYPTDKNKTTLVLMVYPGFVLITFMHIFGKVQGAIPKNLSLAWALIGGILWLAAGALVLEAYVYLEDLLAPLHDNVPTEIQTKLNEGLGAGVIGVLNGIVHLGELALIAKFDSGE